MGNGHRIVIGAAVVALGLQGAVPLAASEGERGVTYSSCFVQEIHTPMPEGFLGSALPKGFRPAEYDPSISGTGDAVSTMISCKKGSRGSSELWVWTAVEPPKNLRSGSRSQLRQIRPL